MKHKIASGTGDGGIDFYLDTSAILKVLITETGSQKMEAYFCKFKKFHMLSLCFAETLNMLKVKYSYRSEIPKKKYHAAVALLLIYCKNNIVIHEAKMSLSNTFPEVTDIINKYNIDFIDAFQINYLIRNTLAQNSLLVTADNHLAEAAKSEKLNVWNCLKDAIP